MLGNFFYSLVNDLAKFYVGKPSTKVNGFTELSILLLLSKQYSFDTDGFKEYIFGNNSGTTILSHWLKMGFTSEIITIR